MSLVAYDTAPATPLSSSEEEKTISAAILQPADIQSEGQYFRQYNQTPDEIQQPTISGNTQGVGVCHSTNQMESTFCIRDKLLERSLQPSESK